MAVKKKTRPSRKRRHSRPSRQARLHNSSSVPAVAKRKSSSRKSSKNNKKVHGTAILAEMTAFEPRGLGARTGGQAGDLQGVSGAEGAGSESVEELLEEGNAFEAEIVQGVEQAESADEVEVETHEVPEDDVPEEYIER
jgi:hypothetical protein